MTATGSVSYLPAIRPTRPLFAGNALDHQRTGTRSTPPPRVYRLSPNARRNCRIYLQNTYVPVEQTKGRLIDLFA